MIQVRKEWNLGVAVGMAYLIYCAGRGTLVAGAALARISHQDLEFWGRLAKQVGRSPADA